MAQTSTGSFDAKTFDEVFDNSPVPDDWARLTAGELRKTYESFNEIRLFVQHEPSIRGDAFVEIGCMAGELFRYLKSVHPRFRYYGFDVSARSIALAKKKYPGAGFFVCQPDLSESTAVVASPAVLFARDVILHQTDPFGFLKLLLSIPKEAMIVRLRTRDKGETVLDVDRSCQLAAGRWFPYMVMNIDEIIETIKATGRAESISIVKHYKQLGGWSARYLPKECYLPETGTAETAIYVSLSDRGSASPAVTSESRRDSQPRYSMVDRCMRLLKNRLLTFGRCRSHRG